MDAIRKVLVAGGAGFLGSHLCGRLLEGGCHVVCADDLSTSKIGNIRPFRYNPRFEFVFHDITKPMDIKIDQIYNMACPASPIRYQADPIKTLKTSFIGALNLIELATKNNARILQASTSEVYGEPEVHPQPESYRGSVNPIGIRACYDEGKRAAEALFFDANRQYGIDIKVVRIFNTYGPNMDLDDGRVVSNFISQALRGEGITVYGDGSQTRSFCYVDDLIDGIVGMMDSRYGFLGPVNLGNPCEFTILELAQKIIGITGSASKIVFEPLPQDDPTQRRPNIGLAKKELGWFPKIGLDEGLKKTVGYFERQIKGCIT